MLTSLSRMRRWAEEEETRQAEVQTAAHQKSAVELADETLQVQNQAAADQKRAVELAEEALLVQKQAATDQKRAVELADEALLVQKQAAIDQKRTADEALQVQKQVATDQKLLAENEFLKAQIISNLNYLYYGRLNNIYDVVTVKVKEGWIVAVIKLSFDYGGKREVLQHSRGPKEYNVENINASLHELHKHYAEALDTEVELKNL